MIRYVDSKKMGRSYLGWLDSHFHFSFAEYYNPDNIQFGVLRVINDDIVQPGTGFDTHSHQNMEILSYVVDGQLSHTDSMNNKHTLTHGQVQYMSAGTGVSHSEHNWGKDQLRFLQIWILPDKNGYKPNYGEYRFAFEDRLDMWLPIATGVDNKTSGAPIRINQDVNVYAAVLTEGKSSAFTVGKGRQAYLVLIEGKADVNGTALSMRDGLEILEEDITITPKDTAHILLIEMAGA
jgi:redox-sensitive bicupin YhaK (pirin superfamily)